MSEIKEDGTPASGRRVSVKEDILLLLFTVGRATLQILNLLIARRVTTNHNRCTAISSL